MTDGHHFNNILLGGRGGTVSSAAAASAAAWSILGFGTKIGYREMTSWLANF